MRRESLGMVEVYGLVVAIEIADAMVKAANVRLGEMTRTKGNGWMTVKVYGDVGAVNAAVDCGKQLAILKNGLIASKVIPRPIDDIFLEERKKELDETPAPVVTEPATVEEKAVESEMKTDKEPEAKKEPENKKQKSSNHKKSKKQSK